MNLPFILIPILLLIVGFLYASVGHGGASGYIAVLSLFSIAASVYKPVVLVLNIIIASIAFMHFYKAGYLKWKLCWPFLITSIPFAFIGSRFSLHDNIHNLLLGLALIFPIVRLSGLVPQKKHASVKEIPLVYALLIGMLLGFAAGLLNIGGGIFLSPVLILFSWANAKESAAAASLFIICNSAAGLLAAGLPAASAFNTVTYLWLTAAIAGGIGGAYFGSKKFKQITVRYILASVLTIASIKLIFFA
ncbi:MAG: sulfite exporter TauE/SafE family protein [Ferruginibacter sp.]